MNFFVPMYRYPAFEAFDDFSDFVESASRETSRSFQVRGPNPCRGAIAKQFYPLHSVATDDISC